MPDDAKPIQDEMAERICLASMMRDEGSADLGLSLLAPDDLLDFGCRLVFQAVAHLRKAGHACGLDMTFVRLGDAKQHDAFAGGAARFLAALYDEAPTGASLPFYAARVRDCSLRRKLIHSARELIRDCTDGVNPAEELASVASESLAKIAQPVGTRGPQLLSALVHQAVERYESQGQGNVATMFLKTGFESFDFMAGGISLGALTIVAARPSVGKSAMGLRLAESAASQRSVLFMSMEMTNAETINRYISGVTRVPLARLRGQRAIEDAEMVAVNEFTHSAWASLPIHIDDRPRQSLGRIISTVRLYVSRYKVGMVVIDYLGLIPKDDHRTATHEHLGNCTSSLKALASELNIAVVLLAQLNRDSVARGPESPPRLSDLKGSGDIEQDADVVLMLHRKPFAERDLEIPIDMIVAKQRNGPVGTVELRYIRPFARFEENPPKM